MRVMSCSEMEKRPRGDDANPSCVTSVLDRERYLQRYGQFCKLLFAE